MTEMTASVLWTGAGRQGLGTVSTETGALLDYPFGFASRTADERRGTNPEEMLSAAHAASFAMAFTLACERAGYASTQVDTRAKVRLSVQDDGYEIDRIALKLEAAVPGLDERRFQALARAAKSDCVLSKALARVPEITLQAHLVQAPGVGGA